MTTRHLSLAELGWSPFFQQQLDLHEIEEHIPVRITAVHRDRVEVMGAYPFEPLPMPPSFFEGADEDRPAVGDWLMLDAEALRPQRILERKSLFKRRSAGTSGRTQLIASNVDTLFIVSSCNHDFNLSRMERYLALAHEAEVTPVIVLTKADLAEAPEYYRDQTLELDNSLLVECVNALDPRDLENLTVWCGSGQTVSLVGSSGTGKSTLVNSLSGEIVQDTGGIREDDAKGRHTTTSRSLHILPSGGLILDTPGMREIQLVDVKAGIEAVFEDIEALATQCKFNDCGHASEPGCAIQAAIATGDLTERRLKSWQKLLREEERNTMDHAAQRRKWRAIGKMHRAATQEIKKRGV